MTSKIKLCSLGTNLFTKTFQLQLKEGVCERGVEEIVLKKREVYSNLTVAMQKKEWPKIAASVTQYIIPYMERPNRKSEP